MLKKIYQSPFRVYLLIMTLGVLGLWAGTQLPISLYPNSTKPTIRVSIPFGSLTTQEFLEKYGKKVESELRTIDTDNLEVEKIEAEYRQTNVSYNANFKWGTDPKKAISEVQSLINSLSGRWPREIRDGANVNYWAKSSGFFAVSFYSEERSLQELYDFLDPILVPEMNKVKDAADPGLWNPTSLSLVIELRPEILAQFGLFPKDIEQSINRSLDGYSGGSVVVSRKQMTIQMPREVESLKSFEELLVPTSTGQLRPLKELANIYFASGEGGGRQFKTNGTSSLILFASPKQGGNVKKMAEDLMSIIKNKASEFPKDIKYKVLVDPSEFIRASVNNVLFEVMLAAGLAVLILYLFIGSLKNTATAAIEIPLSMVLAFILMKMTGINLNLISLGGLALSAGMNVDASVVVMENIFRHFEEIEGKLDFEGKLRVIVKAVREVMLPIVSSTIASLVVFIPLAFTSDLANAVLGDLAKAVVFSHGFSAIVALILVPTIRLHIMNKSGGDGKAPKSPIDGTLKHIENGYIWSLEKFLNLKILKYLSLMAIVFLVVGLVTYLTPKLKKEIIGMPDTDWVILGFNTSGNTLVKQMETETYQIEDKLIKMLGPRMLYTFTQIQGANRSMVMVRLKDKKEMNNIWKELQEEFPNTPEMSFWVEPWNPAELPIPNPPQMRLIVNGGDVEDRAVLAQDLRFQLQQADAFPRLWTDPDTKRKEIISLTPYLERWPELRKLGVTFMPNDLADLTRVGTEGRGLGDINFENKSYPLKMKFPEGSVTTKEDLEAMPIGVGEKIIALKALAAVKIKKAKPLIYREDGQSMFVLYGKQDKGKEDLAPASLAKAKEVLAKYKTTYKKDLKLKSNPTFFFEDAEKELTDAFNQLGVAVGLSILLIMFTLFFQFGGFIHSLIVLTAIPLGMLGVIISLTIFESTLSLNSILGVILLNGISVANSIILVDFIVKLVNEGVTPKYAVLTACRKRLRPILITSLTTILGMLPIAFGSGDGGKILQPLGIAVSGGLWVSMIFTLFIVPTLELIYFDWKNKNNPIKLDPVKGIMDLEEFDHQALPIGIQKPYEGSDLRV